MCLHTSHVLWEVYLLYGVIFFSIFFWQSKSFFLKIDIFFTTIFAVELLTNMFSHWFWGFWR